ncbi:FecR family protein [Sphingobacterium sp. UBA1498]|uniref:FecR family protein n=1 Tax=Sphingobacterium sp. UBA1498 TaxID=1947481 RepID=UPI0025FDF88D|nr:FecR domain-containing protein [Sphingobacterium sp. UBA1498]
MMNSKIAALYKKFLKGELSPEENAIFLDLLTSCDRDELPDVEEVVSLDNRDCELNKTTSEDIFFTITGSSLTPRLIPIWKRRWSVISAAACLLLIGLAGLFQFKFKGQKEINKVSAIVHFSNPTKFVKQLVLPDGTHVSLRQGAHIELLSDFDTDSLRRIKLSGEAFFEVAKNAEQPFVIASSGDFDVRVLGTAFNLNCSEGRSSLVLSHGKVRVSRAGQYSFVTPGQKVAYDMRQRQFNVAKADTSIASNWKSDLLSFNQVPLMQIVADLNNLYPDSHLELIDSFRTESYTGYLPASDLEKSLKMLNTAFNQTIIYKK